MAMTENVRRARVEEYLDQAMERATKRLNAVVLGYKNIEPTAALSEVSRTLADFNAICRHLLLIIDDDDRVGYYDAGKHEYIWVGGVVPYAEAIRERAKVDAPQPTEQSPDDMEDEAWGSY